MTTYEHMLQYAHDQNITVTTRPIPGEHAVAYRFRGRALISVESAAGDTDAARTVTLAHEMAHHATGRLRGSLGGFTPPAKDEHAAWRWTILRLAPRARLDAVIERNQGDLWAVAEELGVTKRLIDKAIAYYETQGV